MEELQNKIDELENEMKQFRNLPARLEELEQVVNKNKFSNLTEFQSPVRVSAPISVQAGGKIGLFIGSGAFGLYYGSGAPTVSASKGSLYLRSDGSSTSTRLYVNTDAGTTWTNVTTAA